MNLGSIDVVILFGTFGQIARYIWLLSLLWSNCWVHFGYFQYYGRIARFILVTIIIVVILLGTLLWSQCWVQVHALPLGVVAERIYRDKRR